jgi:peptidoglycan/xylan/chitin deacetylase (PgdA/CDA1 family)
MRPRAVVLTYHAIEPGPPPLCIEPSLFRHHLDTIGEAGARVVGLDRLVAELRSGGPAEPTVAITFDDGTASVAEEAAPLLAERRLPATVFCVARHLGGRSDWPSQPPWAPRLRLAGAPALADLARNGLELGSHGLTHAPLALLAPVELEREVTDSKAALEEATGAAVRWFAYPYGSLPGGIGRALVESAYAGAVIGGNRAASPAADGWAVPRVDAHYLRRPALLARALRGGDAYLAVRRVGVRARRLGRRDYVGRPS